MTEVFKATIALISAHRHLHLQKERRTHAMSGQKCLDWSAKKTQQFASKNCKIKNLILDGQNISELSVEEARN